MGEAGDICRDCNRYENSISIGKVSHGRPSLLLEAAPRFELGIRILQTPALPLGYAARTNTKMQALASLWFSDPKTCEDGLSTRIASVS